MSASARPSAWTFEGISFLGPTVGALEDELDLAEHFGQLLGLAEVSALGCNISTQVQEFPPWLRLSDLQAW